MVFWVGLETHVILNTQTKLYCYCVPNKTICATCVAEPGHAPRVINNQAVDKAVLLGLVLGAKFNDLTFYRKHYHYHDLLAGYQLTQHPTKPLGYGASLTTLKNQKIAIRSVYLEEDPAATVGQNLDRTRSGACLLEIVTEPVFKGSMAEIEAKTLRYLRTLKHLLLDLDMVQKNKIMKTDVNVSVKGRTYRYQIKNLDSFDRIKKSLKAAEKELMNPHAESRDYTYHYTGGNQLISSRPKQKYLYLREPNMPTLEIQPYKKRLKESRLRAMYLLRTAVGKYLKKEQITNKSTAYLFLKKLSECAKKFHWSTTSIRKFLRKPFNQTLYELKNHDLLQNEAAILCKITSLLSKPKLEPGKRDFVINPPILSKNDYETRSPNFVLFIKLLKESLVKDKIRFNSELIMTQLAKYFSSLSL